MPGWCRPPSHSGPLSWPKFILGCTVCCRFQKGRRAAAAQHLPKQDIEAQGPQSRGSGVALGRQLSSRGVTASVRIGPRSSVDRSGAASSVPRPRPPASPLAPRVRAGSSSRAAGRPPSGEPRSSLYPPARQAHGQSRALRLPWGIPPPSWTSAAGTNSTRGMFSLSPGFTACW